MAIVAIDPWSKRAATDPTDLYRLRDGLYAVDLLGAALVHFDFFTKLAAHPLDRAGLCRELGLAVRPADVMLTLFSALELVTSRAGVFHVTERAREFLVRGSTWYMGPYYAALQERPVCRDYEQVLRTGRTANWGSYQDEKAWARAMEDEAFARRFTAAMDCRGAYLAPALAAAAAAELGGRRRLLDVAGGSGVYACGLVAACPGLRATVLEKAPVDRVARQAIAERGQSDRVEVVAGDMMTEEFPAGHDVHLISNVLHDWDEPVVRALLGKSFRALAPGGCLLIHDMHVNEAKTGPLPVAEYSCILMHSTEGKCYSLGELREYLRAAGFVGLDCRPTGADRTVVITCKPA